MFWLRSFCYGGVLSFFSLLCAAQEILYVGVDANLLLNKTLFELNEEFEKQSGIKVVRVKVEDFKDLDHDETWYTDDGMPIDIINGQISQRIVEYYRQGKIKPINHFWNNYKLDDAFSQFKSRISYQGKILALPYQTYTWQIYYFKSFFENRFAVPETIDELITVCQAMAEQDIVPFHTKPTQPWHAMAWFEYITLRLHGLAFFTALTQGEVSYQSDEVKKVLLIWQRLVNANCYGNQYGNLKAAQLVPFFIRKQMGMFFIGVSILPQIHEEAIKDDLSYFYFPKISDIPRYESTPTNAFLVNAKSNKTFAQYKFLSFMSKADTQSRIADVYGTIAASNKALTPTDKYALQFLPIINGAQGFSAFYDRMVIPEFDVASRPFFTDFIVKGNVEHFSHNMEALRQIYYGQLNVRVAPAVK